MISRAIVLLLLSGSFLIDWSPLYAQDKSTHSSKTLKNASIKSLQNSYDSAKITSNAPNKETNHPIPDSPKTAPISVIPSTSRSHIQRALRALDHGDLAEAETLVRSAHALDPGDAQADRMTRILDRLSRPLPDPDLARLSRNLPRNISMERGPHVVLFHQQQRSKAIARVEALESVITAYYLLFSSLGFDLDPPRTRLPSMWFSDASDYRSYLTAEGATEFLSSQGFRHPTLGLVVTYDLERRNYPSPPDSPRLADLGLSIAAHETFHQLIRESSLIPPSQHLPRWLDEGLAMQFEAIEADHWQGFHSPNPVRLSEFHRFPNHSSLSTFLTPRPHNESRVDLFYSHSWAFVSYLLTTRPDLLVQILDHIRCPSTPDLDPPATTTGLPVLLERQLLSLDNAWLESMNRTHPLPSTPKPARIGH